MEIINAIGQTGLVVTGNNEKYHILAIPKLELTDEQRKRVLDWADKLVSGEYTQTSSYLRVHKPDISGHTAGEVSYCCLGVASELSGLGTWEKNENVHRGHGSVYRVADTTCSAYVNLPRIVKDFYGLPQVDGFAVHLRVDNEGNVESYTLDVLNDCGVSFAEIATLIRLAATEGYTLPAV